MLPFIRHFYRYSYAVAALSKHALLPHRCFKPPTISSVHKAEHVLKC